MLRSIKLPQGGLIAIFIFVGLGVSSYSLYLNYQRPPTWAEWKELENKLEVVSGKTFRNQEVPLDGYFYTNCVFKNVTFRFDGRAPFKIHNSEFFSFDLNVRDAPPAVNHLMEALRGFNFIDKKVSFHPTPRP